MSSTSEPSAESAPVGKAPRYAFIDLLRGLALVVMVETHVVNAYLPASVRVGSKFFFWLTFVNGLVAPAFLFATGFSLMLQSNSQWDNWIHFRVSFWRQMRRLGFITLVAYYSHLYGFRLSRYLLKWNDSTMWAKSLQVDVLQCIVASLLVVMALILVLRKKSLFPWGAGLLAVAIALATPWIWAQDFRGRLPLSLALFLNPHGVSLFPIFPWMFFVLAGSLAGHFFLKFSAAGTISKYMWIPPQLGILMIGCGLLLRGVPFTLPGRVNFYTTSPLYLLIRLGCVLWICAFLYKLEIGKRWIPRPIEMAGRESLLVYGVHLWIIYGLLRGKHLGPVLGLQAGYLVCFSLSVAIIVLMLYLANRWHYLKRNYPSQVRRAQAAIVILMIAVFLLS